LLHTKLKKEERAWKNGTDRKETSDQIEPSPAASRGECSACDGGAAQHPKDKKSIFSSLANPAASGKECARYRGS
jgi:hypothetical protein